MEVITKQQLIPFIDELLKYQAYFDYRNDLNFEEIKKYKPKQGFSSKIAQKIFEGKIAFDYEAAKKALDIQKEASQYIGTYYKMDNKKAFSY